MHKKTFQTYFDQLFSIQAYIALFSYENLKKEHDFIPESDQLSITNHGIENLVIR